MELVQFARHQRRERRVVDQEHTLQHLRQIKGEEERMRKSKGGEVRGGEGGQILLPQ